MTAKIEYVYCVVPVPLDPTGAPRGIDGTLVRLVQNPQDATLSAIVSSLDAAEYAGDRVSERTDDTTWLTPRAIAHDSLITWAADAAAVIPLPMWVMFHDESAVSKMLADRAEEFRGALQRVTGAREFGVRISGSKAALGAAAEKMDGALSLLEQQASAASPGQAYLLGRKLAEARKLATRDAAARIAEHAHEALTSHSRASVPRATALAKEPGVLLDGAYLVPNDDYEAFRAALTGIMAAYEPAGLQFDFTGPWPPYHFVRDN